jgi:hypothetical protein
MKYKTIQQIAMTIDRIIWILFLPEHKFSGNYCSFLSCLLLYNSAYEINKFLFNKLKSTFKICVFFLPQIFPTNENKFQLCFVLL